MGRTARANGRAEPRVSTGEVLAARHVAVFSLTETAQPRRLVDAHWHERAHFSVPLSGAYTEVVDGRRYECVPGSLLVKPAGITHSNLFPVMTTCLIVEVDALGLEEPGLAALFAEPRKLDVARLGPSIRELRRELRTEGEASDLFVQGLLLQILADALRKTGGPQRQARELRPAIDYVHDNFKRPIVLKDVAHAAGLSVAALTRLFHSCMGCTVGEYVRRLRVDQALATLASTDDPISMVAFSAGFSDQSHLTRLFRRYVGQTPAEFRNQARRS